MPSLLGSKPQGGPVQLSRACLAPAASPAYYRALVQRLRSSSSQAEAAAKLAALVSGSGDGRHPSPDPSVTSPRLSSIAK